MMIIPVVFDVQLIITLNLFGSFDGKRNAGLFKFKVIALTRLATLKNIAIKIT